MSTTNENINGQRKTVLLLSYYFEPCNYVAANRPNSFVKELLRYGFEVVVITRHWTGKEKLWEDYIGSNTTKVVIEKSEHLTVHRLPYKHTTHLPNELLSKFQTIYRLAAGQINCDVNYYQYRPYIESLLEEIKVDLIMVSTPPLNVLKLGAEISIKYKTKLFVDVRDFQNHIILTKNGKARFEDMLRHRLTLFYSIKWFKQASLIFTVTPPITEFIQQYLPLKVLTIMNGFQEKLLSVQEKENENFYITLVGSLYPIPEFTEMLDGFKLLFTQEFSKSIKVQFIGSGTSESIIGKIENSIPANNLIIKARIPQQMAQIEAARSQLLLVLGFKNMNGVLGTKPFEYMGLRKTIIQMPGDKGLMEDIILNCAAGYCPATPIDFVATIRKCFFEWQKNGSILYQGKLDLIKKYSREEQFKELLPYLKTI